VLSLNSSIITSKTVTPKLSTKLFNKSCVNGRGGFIPSNSNAIAWASKAPIIIGKRL